MKFVNDMPTKSYNGQISIKFLGSIHDDIKIALSNQLYDLIHGQLLSSHSQNSIQFNNSEALRIKLNM